HGVAARIVALVGPEGGFDRAEAELLAQHGAARIALGTQVLRIETAAVALLAAIHQWLDATAPTLDYANDDANDDCINDKPTHSA
ncbi:MAG: RsmE family RNA methyltransferase, partial [bacterium]